MRLLCLFCAILFAAFAAAPATYVGDWSASDGDASGSLKIVVLEPGPQARCEASFTVGDGSAVKPTVKACKVDADRIEADLQYELDGNKLHSKLQGTVKDGVVKGKYQSFSADDQQSSSGIWKATLQK